MGLYSLLVHIYPPRIESSNIEDEKSFRKDKKLIILKKRYIELVH